MNDTAVMLGEQRDVFFVDLGHMHSLEPRAEQLESREPGQGAFAMLVQRLLNFVRGFMDVHMNAGVHLGDQDSDVFEFVIRNRIRRVRPERDRDTRVMLEIIEQCHAIA